MSWNDAIEMLYPNISIKDLIENTYSLADECEWAEECGEAFDNFDD